MSAHRETDVARRDWHVFSSFGRRPTALLERLCLLEDRPLAEEEFLLSDLFTITHKIGPIYLSSTTSTNMPGTQSMTTTATVRPILELRDYWSELGRSPPTARPDDNREMQPHLTSGRIERARFAGKIIDSVLGHVLELFRANNASRIKGKIFACHIFII